MINNANIGPYLIGKDIYHNEKNNSKIINRTGNAQCPTVIPSKQQQQKLNYINVFNSALVTHQMPFVITCLLCC